MSFKDFVAGLNPFLSKEQTVLSSSEKALGEIRDSVGINTMLDRCYEFSKGKQIKSPFGKAINKSFYANDRTKPKSGTFIDALKQIYPNIEKNLQSINGLLEKNPNSVYSTAALSFADVTIIQYINSALFCNQYTSSMLAVFIACEKNILDGVNETDGLTKGEMEYLNNNLGKYITHVASLSLNPEKFKKAVEEIPKTVFDPEAEQATFTIGDKERLDPLSMRFLPLSINPFFIVGKIYVEYQHSRYEALKTDLSRIETRIQIAQAQASTNPSAGQEKLLEALEKRRKDIWMQIQKHEEK